MNLRLKELSIAEKDIITQLFLSVFTQEPWNDDWSDEKQLDAYITDLTGNLNSLSLGVFDEDGNIVGMSLGNIKHWYSGTEYCIDELCVLSSMQGQGVGSKFLELIEEYLKDRDIYSIYLQTERDVPAYNFYKKRNFFELKGHVSFAKDI